jgi:hypothetical protein
MKKAEGRMKNEKLNPEPMPAVNFRAAARGFSLQPSAFSL